MTDKITCTLPPQGAHRQLPDWALEAARELRPGNAPADGHARHEIGRALVAAAAATLHVPADSLMLDAEGRSVQA